MKSKIISFTGHGIYEINKDQLELAEKEINNFLELNDVRKALVGMCHGIDMLAARICFTRGLPYVACMPFKGQEQKWSRQLQIEYGFLLRHAKEVVIVSEGGYANWKYHSRNKFMVAHSDQLVACSDGRGSGGTATTIKFAEQIKKPIWYIKL